jgi:ribulose-5-phosphate 4-epimerase/fuculose-1-phosphate aldolase
MKHVHGASTILPYPSCKLRRTLTAVNPTTHEPLLASSQPSEAGGSTKIDDIRLYRRRETAIGYRILGAYGWGSTGDGHVSARDPELLDHFWLARYGVPFNQVTLNDIVLVGPNGKVVDAPGGVDSGINPAAYLIHWPIHEARPDIIAAAHTHTPYGTPLAARREKILPITQESCAFFENHVLFEDEELDIVTLDGGKRIASAMGPARCAILANHGLLTSGQTVAEAIGWFVTMERVCESQMKAGDGALPISDEGAREVRRSNGGVASGWHMGKWLARRHVPDLSAIS